MSTVQYNNILGNDQKEHLGDEDMSIRVDQLFSTFVELQTELDKFQGLDSVERRKLPLHDVVRLFAKFSDNLSHINWLKENDWGALKMLAGRIRILSESKCDFYKSSWIDFSKGIFSSFRNLWVLNVFESSGALGVMFSNQLLDKVGALYEERAMCKSVF